MIIKSIDIDNYRNFSNAKIDFSENINFIVGENNIGKTNILNLIDIIVSGRNFEETDFTTTDKGINVIFSLLLNDDELGVFGDCFDPSNKNIINISICQNAPEDIVSYKHKESGTKISRQTLIKNINFISYDSLRNPKVELNFYKTKGAGLFLNYLIEKYLSLDTGSPFLVEEKIDKINKYLQTYLDKLSCFNHFGIRSGPEESTLDILSQIFKLRDGNNIELSKSGYGIQFNILITLSILERVVRYVKALDKDSSSFNCIISLDEPEIHLSPFYQRSTIDEIQLMASGKDENFNNILDELFGIKKFSAQIIVVTHSREIIGNNYKNISRLYFENSVVKIVSGSNLTIGCSGEIKHWYKELTYVKEAMFAKKVILVEGDSEQAAVPCFATKMGINLNEHSVAVIKTSGADTFPPLAEMFKSFKIEPIIIIDNDKPDIDEKLEKITSNVYRTRTKCFDSEIAECLFAEHVDLLLSILNENSSDGQNKIIQSSQIRKYKKNGLVPNSLEEKDYKFSDLESTDITLKYLYSIFFALRKGIILGQFIGENCPKENIPSCYREAIIKAIE